MPGISFSIYTTMSLQVEILTPDKPGMLLSFKNLEIAYFYYLLLCFYFIFYFYLLLF